MPASSATAARSAVRRLAMRRRRISAAVSSPRSSGFSISTAISSNSGSAPSSMRRVRKRHSLTASPLRNGLLPKIAASRRRPIGGALQSRAARAAASSGAAASASSQASKPSARRRASAGCGSPSPSGERWDSSFTPPPNFSQTGQSGEGARSAGGEPREAADLAQAVEPGHHLVQLAGAGGAEDRLDQGLEFGGEALALARRCR